SHEDLIHDGDERPRIAWGSNYGRLFPHSRLAIDRRLRVATFERFYPYPISGRSVESSREIATIGAMELLRRYWSMSLRSAPVAIQVDEHSLDWLRELAPFLRPDGFAFSIV